MTEFLLSRLLGRLWVYLRPFVRQYLVARGVAILEAALAAVRLMEETELPGDVKREHAREMIREAVRDSVPDISTAEIDDAIQAALRSIREGRED